MKLYHTETQEEYNALMAYVEKKGYEWNTKEKPTEYNCWNIFKKETVIVIEYDINLGFASKGYCERFYIDTPIQKYKATRGKVTKCHDDAANAMKALSAGGVSVKNENTDNVNNPSHYTAGGIETLDYIKAKVKDYPSYVAGNILKYVSRYEHKNGIEDLKKAQFYLNDLIEWMESD
ncbi:DUF3310 domain-containing protein [Listeria monocytogenes]|uniref:DUF3310 domain-containing protein n=1 Tax=Listeria monocytogenes TaxID=1639 RepID=UPI0004D612AA|nr:DUF3310 domain-containing protein [Listeria monocytogenes]EAA0127334.1 DUF3310 domain-containing protein [Listeria monocytogenes]EAA0196624.1 DUF3310 domain-containing protein [Listeria monocytogenes]EAA0257773.1 DUF3310 domain-containing protein [Listeria monocytogenes]EAA0279995.1 DUF3310 domain-containing protein [Listeria monocytogenes]EAC2587805.1 DUF3310 domain-containing protein [Listeria monocytogenes]